MQEIFLAPIEFSSRTFLLKIKSELMKLIHVPVNILDLRLDLESAFSAERNQYHSTSLLAQAEKLVAEVNGKVVLLLESDIYVPVLTYVFGEAQLNGKLSIVSLCRLHEEFYTGISNEELLLQRSIKEILHELGHNFGLYHCRDWNCVMHSSAGIEEVDIKGDNFCNSCAVSVEIVKY
jgi:archaemetzincin